jgi:hypothetical protein
MPLEVSMHSQGMTKCSQHLKVCVELRLKPLFSVSFLASTMRCPAPKHSVVGVFCLSFSVCAPNSAIPGHPDLQGWIRIDNYLFHRV